MKKLLIKGEYIRLCDALKLSGEADTGGIAKLLILEGKVAVNGEICLQKGRKLAPGDRFAIGGAEYQIVL